MCPVELSQEQAIDIFNSLRNQPALETMFHEAGAPILQDNSPRQVTKQAHGFVCLLIVWKVLNEAVKNHGSQDLSELVCT